VRRRFGASGGVRAVVRLDGGHAAVDGGVDVWERVASEWIAATASEGRGPGTGTTDRARRKGRSGSGERAA